MLRRRSTLQKRDRDSGLGFNWRVPVSSATSLFVALLVVGAVAVVLAVGVNVRVGKDRSLREHRATMTLIPSGPEGDALEWMAREAGPYPFRRQAATGGVQIGDVAPLSIADPAYVPDLSAVGISADTDGRSRAADWQVLPPLPVVGERRQEPSVRSIRVGLLMIGGDKKAVLDFGEKALPVAESSKWLGERFLIGYEESGRVTEVVPLDPKAMEPEVMQWLREVRVMHATSGDRWLVVECVSRT